MDKILNMNPAPMIKDQNNKVNNTQFIIKHLFRKTHQKTSLYQTYLSLRSRDIIASHVVLAGGNARACERHPEELFESMCRADVQQTLLDSKPAGCSWLTKCGPRIPWT